MLGIRSYPLLDEVAIKFSKISTFDEKKQVSAENIALATTVNDSDANAQVYARLFEKTVETAEFLESASRHLEKLIKSGTVSMMILQSTITLSRLS
ncbi:hypothetical protein BGZ65_012544 [Modicella reniformis]|uniref:Endoplasmic reticulum resident protein 29 C-terminal domain-containing protein n=1 Tax=Modicella reniformis TaxID=1440133 RepID=A0A9P6MCP6_9FUNG|nr:hypothetical protein BGZ65_012544 [Modicella reniformis]